METEQIDHGFNRALESSPEAPKKKREMATTSMATSSSGNNVMQAEHPTPAPKPSNLSLSLSLFPNEYPAQGEQRKTRDQDPHHVIEATTKEKKHLTLVLSMSIHPYKS